MRNIHGIWELFTKHREISWLQWDAQCFQGIQLALNPSHDSWKRESEYRCDDDSWYGGVQIPYQG
jgi:hypothetical protein